MDSKCWYYKKEGERLGPYTKKEIEEKIQKGEITDKSSIIIKKRRIRKESFIASVILSLDKRYVIILILGTMVMILLLLYIIFSAYNSDDGAQEQAVTPFSIGYKCL